MAASNEEMLPISTACLLPLPIFATLWITYEITAPHLDSEKKRAYILSALSSAIMSTLSLPFAWEYLRLGLRGYYEISQSGWFQLLGRVGVVYFATYLFADLVVGYVKYPTQIGMLTGWVHHSCYIALMGYCLLTRDYPLFLVSGIMEIPTFDLGISTILPRVRNDLRFLTSFFFFRIAFHLAFLIDCTRQSSRQIFDVAWMPTIMHTLALSLHVMWFKGGVTGYLRRSKAARAKRAEGQKTGDAIMDAAADIDPSVLSTVPSSSPEATTPEDSPLVTPYTPSAGPIPLRESYIPSLHLPTLPHMPQFRQLPHLSQLPSVSIPNIPSIPSISELTAALQAHRENINFGFKDAVRNRSRRFSMMGGKGSVISLNFGNIGNLGLRRRETQTSEEDLKAEDLLAEDDPTSIEVHEVIVE